MNKSRLLVWMILLALLAGFINTIAVFCYAGATVSHITGLVSKAAISVFSGEGSACLYPLSILLAFFAGAVAAGIATGERAFYLHKIYGFLILAIGLLVLLPLFLGEKVSVFLLAFLMGLQNGMVVSYKGIVVRLTHMTGNITDFGVFIGYKIRGNKNEKPISGLVPGAALAGFAIGGLLGIFLFGILGRYVFVVASAVYLFLGLVYFRLQKTCTDRNFNGIPDDRE